MYEFWYFHGVMARGAYVACVLHAARSLHKQSLMWKFNPVTFAQWGRQPKVINEHTGEKEASLSIMTDPTTGGQGLGKHFKGQKIQQQTPSKKHHQETFEFKFMPILRTKQDSHHDTGFFMDETLDICKTIAENEGLFFSHKAAL